MEGVLVNLEYNNEMYKRLKYSLKDCKAFNTKDNAFRVYISPKKMAYIYKIPVCSKHSEEGLQEGHYHLEFVDSFVFKDYNINKNSIIFRVGKNTYYYYGSVSRKIRLNNNKYNLKIAREFLESRYLLRS